MRERKRRKQTLEDIIYKWKKPYMNIILLTLHFQDNFKDKNNGLRLIHYRYALVKNHNIKSSIGLLGLEGMKQFFSWKLKQLYYLNEIEKCITTTSNLSKYLKNLEEMKALQDISDKKEKLGVYRIDQDNFKKIEIAMKQSLIRKIFNEYPDIYEILHNKIMDLVKNELKNRGMINELESIKQNLSVFSQDSN